MSQGPLMTSAKDLLHYGMVAVPLGLDQLERGIGEGGVVAPGREQFIPAPRRDAVTGPWRPRYRRSRRPAGRPRSRGYLIGVQASSPVTAIAARMLAFTGGG
jgi:hypothetical protein